MGRMDEILPVDLQVFQKGVNLQIQKTTTKLYKNFTNEL